MLARDSIVRPEFRSAGHRKTVTGPASTLRLRRVHREDADGSFKILQAYDNLPAGTIVAVDVVGDPGGGVIGDLVGHRLSQIGLLGAIVNGPVRDTDGLLACGFCVWAREFTLSGMELDELQVETGVDVNLGGVCVSQNDLISAGNDGIFVISRNHVDQVLRVAAPSALKEKEAHRDIASGQAVSSVYKAMRSAAGAQRSNA
jgi:regulator of RNase E activity RraA